MKYLVYVLSLVGILAFTSSVSTKTNSGAYFSSIIKDTIVPKPIDTSSLSIGRDTTVLALDSAKPASKQYFGIASFYSKNLEGTPTSTQEVFRHNKFTCASNRFKLHTWLRVTNISNGKSIIVRVNDRMHPKMDAKGRIVDLSLAGARALNFTAKGLTKVMVEVVTKGTKK